jgi:hypothetical protein
MFGYSFDDDPSEMRRMKEEGANAVGMGAIWRPIRAEEELYGVDAVPPYAMLGAERIGQSFEVDRPFRGIAVHTPTWGTSGSAFTLCLYHVKGDNPPVQIARRRFTDVADNVWLALDFPTQQSGVYLWEMIDGEGRIGAWAKFGNVYRGGEALIGEKRMSEIDFETRILYADGTRKDLFPTGDPHISVPLGWGRLNTVQKLDMSTNFSVGNWNNGHFPMYPDWLFEFHPDVAMLDQNGEPFMAGIFGRSYPWVSIDHPAIVSGTGRFIRRTVEMLKDTRCIAYWVMGSESLFPTYSFPGRWADYGRNAVMHFRRWLELRYKSIAALNEVWGTRYQDFDEIEPPRDPDADMPSLDWFGFRERAMAERFQWHYAGIRALDPHRPILTCNHGDIYSGIRRTEMGASPTMYSGVSDGFETGQIVVGDDPALFNLMYFRSLWSFGKPVCPARLAYKLPDPKARGGGRSFTPQAARRYVYECLGMGAWHVGLIQWRGSLPDGEWGIKGTPAQDEVRRIFGEIERMHPWLDGMWTVRPRIAFYLSDKTWLLRGFQREWLELHRLFTWHHLPAMFVYDYHLVNDDLDGYELVISLADDILPDEAFDGLRRFADEGGIVVADGKFARFNALLRERKGEKIGRNFVRVRSDEVSPEVIAERVVWMIDELCPRARYLHLNVEPRSQPFIKEEFTTLRWAQRNLADDMSGRGSLGQTISIPGPVHSISISTPTYLKQVTDYGFTIRVRLNGPDGKLIGSKRVNPPIADNAWHEMEIGRDDPPGTVYYVEVIPDTNLPPRTIGWWGRNEDVYTEGNAYVNGRPVPYDREVVLRLKRHIPATGAVESFLLSDGLNFIAVLINVTNDEVHVRGELDKGLMPDDPSRYEVRELLTDERVGGGNRFSLDLTPCATAVLLFERRADEGQFLELSTWLGDRVARLRAKGYLTPVMEALYERAIQHGRARRYARAAALMLRAANQIGIRIEELGGDADNAGGGIRVVISLSSMDGGPVDDAEVYAELVPLFGLRRVFRHVGVGRYELCVTKDEMPSRYDYAGRRYVPYDGPIELLIYAVKGRGEGVLRVIYPGDGAGRDKNFR